MPRTVTPTNIAQWTPEALQERARELRQDELSKRSHSASRQAERRLIQKTLMSLTPQR